MIPKLTTNNKYKRTGSFMLNQMHGKETQANASETNPGDPTPIRTKPCHVFVMLSSVVLLFSLFCFLPMVIYTAEREPLQDLF